jgi:two-component system phosphate regulon response regulator PhoB
MESVLIVDADAESADALARRLRDPVLAVATASSAAAAVRMVSRDAPSLLLLDGTLPDGPGTDVIKRLRNHATTRSIPIILVSRRADEVDRVLALELGADDFVAKPFSTRELALRVRAILRRAARVTPMSADHLRIGPIDIDVPGHRVTVRGEPVSLSALELRLLLHIGQRHGRVQSRDELLARVWRHSRNVDPRTVDTHVKRLRSKLGPAGDVIETVRGFGYRVRVESSPPART